MRTLFEARGCSVLYNLLRSLDGERSFLLPANVCPIVPATFIKAGRAFTLVDIAEPDLMMDRDRCLDLLQEGAQPYAGLLFVRTYGADGDEDDFFLSLKQAQPDLIIIDDKCLGRPDPDGINLSRMADVTLFSTGHAKYVDLDYGGFAFVEQRVKYQRQDSEYSETAMHALNNQYRTADDQCAFFQSACEAWLDLSQPALPWNDYRDQVDAALKKADEHKESINAIYRRALPDEIQLAHRFQGWRFNIRVPESERLVARLFQAGLFASRHYPPLISLSSDEDFPIAEQLHENVVNLFNDGNYDANMARRTAELVIEHLAALR